MCIYVCVWFLVFVSICLVRKRVCAFFCISLIYKFVSLLEVKRVIGNTERVTLLEEQNLLR